MTNLAPNCFSGRSRHGGNSIAEHAESRTTTTAMSCMKFSIL
jgi:hypothetical protein